MKTVASPAEVIDLWFSPETQKLWFASTPAFDAELRERFEATWQAARDGELGHWEDTAASALALVIVLDQFPLNMYRGLPLAFSTEAASRAVAARALARGLDERLDEAQKPFLYLPYMHSEDLADQDRSVELFERAGLTDGLKWARHHREIVRRFGRFPHRNAILGRESTRAELDWLAGEEAFHG